MVFRRDFLSRVIRHAVFHVQYDIVVSSFEMRLHPLGLFLGNFHETALCLRDDQCLDSCVAPDSPAGSYAIQPIESGSFFYPGPQTGPSTLHGTAFGADQVSALFAPASAAATKSQSSLSVDLFRFILV